MAITEPALIQPQANVLARRTLALHGDDQLILNEARVRFRRAWAWERTARVRWKEDYRFCNADADNQWQWPATIYEARVGRPCLTINKTRQHCLQIINDARQNKAAVKITATGGDATAQSADIYEGIVRHIEYISNAPMSYDMGSRHQIMAGIGYWRLLTEYLDDDSTEQDIFIRPIIDPTGVLLDCDIQQEDGSDARWGFVFTDPAREVVEADYPQFRNRPIPSGSMFGEDDNVSRMREDTIRVCEYMRIVEVSDEVFVTPDGRKIKASETDSAEMRQALRDNQDVRKRKFKRRDLQWFKIVGDEIVDRRPMPGRYIPLVRVIGEETVIDGQMDRKGHTRALKDPQRMYNYNRSAEVEYGALQTKAPWIAPAMAIEGKEPAWREANTKNYSVLTWNHRDEEGKDIPPPVRPDPPQGAPVYSQGAQAAADDMMLVSGQYQAMMGAPSNERSGIAIERRQREGDNATYHYIDHLAQAIRYTGRIIVDWIPEVYDSERVVRILAEDGSEASVTIDPRNPQAAMERIRYGQIERIFNPNVGKYEVQADVGKDWGSLRQEAADTILELIQVTQGQVFNVAGDILMRNLTFPGATELADRLKNMLPPQALGGPSPQLQQAQQTIQQLQQFVQRQSDALQKTQDQLATERLRLRGKDVQKDIDIFEADTRRLTALKDFLPVDEMGLRAMVRQLVTETLATSLQPAGAALAPALAQAALTSVQGPMPQQGNGNGNGGQPGSPTPQGGPSGGPPGGMPQGPPPGPMQGMPQ